MANTHETTEPQATGTRSGKELAMIVGVLLMAVAGTLVTYGGRSRSTEEASTGPGAVATAPAEAPAAPRRRVTAATDAQVVHTGVHFDCKSSRTRARGELRGRRQRPPTPPPRQERAGEAGALPGPPLGQPFP